MANKCSMMGSGIDNGEIVENVESGRSAGLRTHEIISGSWKKNSVTKSTYLAR